MSRHLFSLCLVAASIGEAAAQERLSVTRVFTEPNGLRFFVDGQPYRGAQAFIWPAGSKHTLTLDKVQHPFDGQRYTFAAWADVGARFSTSADSFVVTADPSISGIKATFVTEYLVRVLFHQCDPQRAESCRPPGSVTINGVSSSVDSENWYAAESPVTLLASPNAGFVFAGWGPAGGYITSPYLNVTLKSPLTFSNIFAAGKRVTLNTDPVGLLVAPDGTPTRTPADMDWGDGTRHSLGVVSPQIERDNTSRTWVFSHWSNGAKMNDLYLVRDANIPETLTATYVRGVTASFVTVPSGLKLRVDGRENWPAYNFVWGVGTKSQISAPAEQTDSRGRRFVFKGWSNGGPAAQEVTILDEHVQTGFRLVATYEPLSRLSLETSPAGLPLTIDGKECRGNCTIDKPAGTMVEISVAPSIPLSDTNRMEFVGWSDGGGLTRVITVGSESSTSLLASYKNFYKLVAISEPGNGAVFRTTPSSPDGFFEANLPVSVSAEPKPGFRFRRWDGDLIGTFRNGHLEMTAPRVVRAFLDIVPWADEAGARNAAAGEGADPLVAPGSIAAIYGANLAGAYEAGRPNPLAQTIGSVIVRIADRLMPLVSVAPDQIQFQVPSDLAEGQHWIYARWGTHTEVRTQLNVGRNAPGLFHRKQADLSYASAVHEDGSEITLDSPARKGERVTVFGTGFGPYDKAVPDGFAVPAGMPFNLADTLEVFTADRLLELDWAGAVAGKVGMAMARFRIPEALPPATDGVIPIRVRVNGRESNTVLLRVE